jgi:hypothetical protein
MEFRHRSVRLVFKLVLGATQTNMIVDYLSLGKPNVGSRQSFAPLVEAIADARLYPRISNSVYESKRYKPLPSC